MNSIEYFKSVNCYDNVQGKGAFALGDEDENLITFTLTKDEILNLIANPCSYPTINGKEIDKERKICFKKKEDK